VLRYLIDHRTRVVPKEELLDEIWGDRFVSESTLTSRIKAARRAIGDDGRAQHSILTVHGVGYRFVAEVAVGEGHAAPAPSPAPADTDTRLPEPRTRLIGRDDELAALVGQVDEARLVGLVGPGGVGKTTIALAAARAWCERSGRPGVWADLIPARTGEDVARVVASAAGVEGEASRSVEQLAEHLGSRDVLVVLDNCEHVLAAAADLAERIVRTGPGPRVLATSREPLGVYEERIVPLEPLAAGAAELFVERARQAEPRVAWDAEDAAVVDLCRQLDGLPLALELAAGQLRRWDFAELARRLEGRLGALAGGSGRSDDRHQTMADAIGWSYQLLEPTEQVLLRHLSVFPSWFDLDTVEAVAPLVDAPVADTLADLVDKSLVVRDPEAGRYRLLETIRLYGGERLEMAGEAEAAREHHRRHLAAMAARERRVDRWLSARLAAAQRRRLDDARQAFWASLDAGAGTDATEIAVASAFLWRQALGCTEGATWVAALGRADLEPADRRWVRILEADLGQGLGDFGMLVDATIAAQAEDDGSDGDATCILDHYAGLLRLTEPGEGRPAFEAVLAGAEDPRLADLMRLFLVVADLAALADGRPVDLDDLERRLAQVEASASEDGYERFVLHWSGWMYALARRNGPLARRWFAGQRDYLDRTGVGDTWITSYSDALAESVEGEDVTPLLRRAYALAEREGYRVEGDFLLGLAYSVAGQGDPVRAAELLGTAIAGRFNATAHFVLYRVVIEPVVRAGLDADAFDAALARGRAASAVAALGGYGIGPATLP
jgi:predicted ATPase